MKESERTRIAFGNLIAFLFAFWIGQWDGVALLSIIQASGLAEMLALERVKE